MRQHSVHHPITTAILLTISITLHIGHFLILPIFCACWIYTISVCNKSFSFFSPHFLQRLFC